MNIIRKIQKRWFPETLKCVYRKDILEYALKHHRYVHTRLNYPGLCLSISYALTYYGIEHSPINIEAIIPLFTNNNAVNLFNAAPCEFSFMDYWWPKGEWNTGRLDFLKWLLKQYKDDKTNLKKL